MLTVEAKQLAKLLPGQAVQQQLQLPLTSQQLPKGKGMTASHQRGATKSIITGRLLQLPLQLPQHRQLLQLRQLALGTSPKQEGLSSRACTTMGKVFTLEHSQVRTV